MKLTSFSHGAGCGCKLGQAELDELMQGFNIEKPSELIVGTETGDDAAVWKLDSQTALVFTTDFFTPIVDDPYDWGRIAATNAISDVYAMGGRPIMALNLVAWPRDDLPFSILRSVLSGGGDAARSAGAIVAGGHSIDDKEPKYGMAVIGLVHPDHVVTNSAARPGDSLYLTKPIGTGVIATALKRGESNGVVLQRAVDVMTTLNREASQKMIDVGARAATDVTGFGLLGHLRKMAAASGVSARINANAVPLIEGASELAARGMISGGTKRNLEFVNPHVKWNGASETQRFLLADAQTSGGLLISCDKELPYPCIGSMQEGAAGSITVED
ncbi:MAG: selenide, water dikinase SelD [Actinomycetota bacterium]